MAKRSSQEKPSYEELLKQLKKDNGRIDTIEPYLSSSLKSHLKSDAFKDESLAGKFDVLDKSKKGGLNAQDVVPLILSMTKMEKNDETKEKCKTLFSIFDKKSVGSISRSDFPDFVRYILVSHFLSSNSDDQGGKSSSSSSSQAPETVKDVIRLLEKNYGRTSCVEKYLPDHLITHLSSEGFKENGLRGKFDVLDKSGRGYLSATDLCPIIFQLAKMEKNSENTEKAKSWVSKYDKSKSGKIEKDDFPEFVRFVLVVSYFSSLPEDQPLSGGKAPKGEKKEKAATKKEDKGVSGVGAVTVKELRQMLINCKGRIKDISEYLPDSIITHINSAAFQDAGLLQRYDMLDKTKRGYLATNDVIPIVLQLAKLEKNNDTIGVAKKWVEAFDKSGQGRITKKEFPDFVRYVLVMSFLQKQKDDDKMKINPNAHKDVAEGSKTYGNLLLDLEEAQGRIDCIKPYIASNVRNHLNSDSFSHDALVGKFDMMDKTKKGFVGAPVLQPVVLQLSKMSASVMNPEKVKSMINIFDKSSKGVVKRDEFPDFVRYIIVFAWLSGFPEDQEVEVQGGKMKENKTDSSKGPAKSSKSKKDTDDDVDNDPSAALAQLKKCDEIIRALESDSSELDRILKCMPKTLVEDITNESFNKKCIAGFKKLDTENKGVVHPVKLVSGVVKLADGHPAEVEKEDCKKYTSFFAEDVNAGIARNDVTNLCRFIIVMGYLKFVKNWKDAGLDPNRRNKVERLMKIMKESKDKTWEILPLLPDDLQDGLASGAFTQDCKRWFAKFDKDTSGSLSIEEIVPCIKTMCQAYPFTFSKEQCKEFLEYYDKDGIEEISETEITDCVRFILLMSYLTSEVTAIKKTSTDIVDGAKKVEQFLNIIERDRNAVQKIVPVLPDRVFQHLTSKDFEGMAKDRFESLNTSGSGTLTPEELRSVIVEFSEAPTAAVDIKYCKRFTAVFDVDEDGLISLDEFLSFTRFMTIIKYLKSSEGKKDFPEGTKILRDSRLIEDMVKVVGLNGTGVVDKLAANLSEEVQDMVRSDGFASECKRKYKELDKTDSGKVTPQQLVPVILELTDGHHHAVDSAQSKRLMEKFDASNKGGLSSDEFVNLARFLMVMTNLQGDGKQDKIDELAYPKQEDPSSPRPAEGGLAMGPTMSSNEGAKKVEQFLTMLEADREAVKKIVPKLPKKVFEHLTSDEFTKESQYKFKALNKNKNTSLSPKELYPIIVELSEANPQSVDLKQCERFCAMFAMEDGINLTLDDFVNFARFMHIMMYCLSEEGKESFPEGSQILTESRNAAIAIEKESASAGQNGSTPAPAPKAPKPAMDAAAAKEKLEGFLAVLENDKNLIPKIVKMLPKRVFTEMTSKDFMKKGNEKFTALDADQDEELTPQELYPLIVELSEVPAHTVDIKQCERFTKIFDSAGCGYLDMDAFLNFLRFMHISKYVHSEEAKEEFPDGIKILSDSAKVKAHIAMLERAPDEVVVVLPCLPEDVQNKIMGEEFNEEADQAFDALTNGQENLGPEQLKQEIVTEVDAHPMSVDLMQCKRFIAIFDDDQLGYLTKETYLTYKRFLEVMRYLQTEAGKNLYEEALARGNAPKEKKPKPVVPEIAEDSAGAKQVEEILSALENDRATIQKLVPLLPRKVFEHLTDHSFVEETQAKFDELDLDLSGTLDSQELYSLIVEISHASPQSVDFSHCERFVHVFDMHEDGVLRLDEFLNFKRFMYISTYINSAEGKKEFPDGSKILADSHKIEELLHMLEQASHDIQETLPHLSEKLRNEVMSAQFVSDAEGAFAELDEDAEECLGPLQLKPIILTLTGAHDAAVDIYQCKRILHVFDDDDSGVLEKDEFLNFKRYMCIMCYLQTGEEKTLRSDLGIGSANRRHGVAPVGIGDESEGAKRVEQFLSLMEQDRNAVQKIVPLLPKKMFDSLTSDEFMEACKKTFVGLLDEPDEDDEDYVEALSPQCIYPIIVELSQAPPQCIDFGQCERFVSIFDMYDDGVLHWEEFLNFKRFMQISLFLHSEEGLAEFPEGMKILTDSKKVEQMLVFQETSPVDLEAMLGNLPPGLKEELTDDKFRLECARQFKKIDDEGHGYLSPCQVMSIITATLDVHKHSVDLSQCARFVACFDKEEKSGLTKDAFLNLMRFLKVMKFAHTDSGKAALGSLGMDDKPMKSGAKLQKSQEESEGARRVEEFLDVLENDQKAVQKIIPLLPKKVFKQMSSDQFVAQAETKFQSLDTDNDEVLTRQELFPMVVELSQAPPQIVDLTHCERFIKIFDMRNSGMMELDEFMNFLRFMQISMYLASKDGKEDFPEGRKILSDSKLIEDVLKLLEQLPVDDIDKLLDHIPDNLKTMVTGDTFTDECAAAFKKLDPQGKGVIPSLKLKQTILTTTGANPHAVDTTQCKRLATIFSQDDSGNLTEKGFEKFKRALMLGLYFQSPDGKKALGVVKKSDNQAAATATAVLVAGKSSVKGVRGKSLKSLGAKHIDEHDKMAAQRVEDFLVLLEQDKHAVQKIIPLLPSYVFERLTGDEFLEEANDQFQEHDDDEDNALSPQELFPLIVEMSEARAQDVDFKQCERFVGIFDMHQDAVLREDEFLNFKRFMHIITYLDSEQGKTDFPEGRKILDDSRKVEDLILVLQDEAPKDHDDLFASLPSSVKEMIEGEEFAQHCAKEFSELDVDSDTCLAPHQLKPMILGIADAHPSALDNEQCERFAAIFDLKERGVIDKEEFTLLKKFLVIFSQTETGSKALGIKRLTRKSTKLRQSTRIEESDSNMARELLDFLAVIEHDKRVIETIMDMLPAHVKERLDSEEFFAKNKKRYDELDSDQDGKLYPQEFWSAIVDYSKAPAQSVDLGCTKRFLKIFDLNKDGTIYPAEFQSFARVMEVSAYVHSEKGVDEFPDGLQIMLDAKRVEAVVKLIEMAPNDIREVLPHVPDEMKTDIMGEEFSAECTQSFKALDAEGSERVSAEQLKSVLIDTVSVGEHAVDLHQCQRLAMIFGVTEKEKFSSELSPAPAEKVGVNFYEFLNLRRFLRVFTTLQREQEAENRPGPILRSQSKASRVTTTTQDPKASEDSVAKVVDSLPQIEEESKATVKTLDEHIDLLANASDAEVQSVLQGLDTTESRQLEQILMQDRQADEPEVDASMMSFGLGDLALGEIEADVRMESASPLGEYTSMLGDASVLDINMALDATSEDDRKRLQNALGPMAPEEVTDDGSF